MRHPRRQPCQGVLEHRGFEGLGARELFVVTVRIGNLLVAALRRFLWIWFDVIARLADLSRGWG